MKGLKYASIGLAIGFVLTTMYMILFVGLNSITTQLLGWVIASAIFGVSSIIFEGESRMPLVNGIIHYGICLVVILVMTYIFYIDYILYIFISYSISYLVIYLIIWYVEKSNVKRINQKLNSK